MFNKCSLLLLSASVPVFPAKITFPFPTIYLSPTQLSHPLLHEISPALPTLLTSVLLSSETRPILIARTVT